MPTWRAIAAAVRPWSPVTTMIRMPASWQRRPPRPPPAAAGRPSRPARGSRARARRPRALGQRRRRGEPALRDAEHAQALAGVASTSALDLARARRRRAGARARRVQHDRRAPRQHRLRRALGVDPQRPSRSSTVDISLSAGSKWNWRRRRSLALRRVDVGAELARPPRASPPRSGRRSARVRRRAAALLHAAIASASRPTAAAARRGWSSACLEVERLRRRPDVGDAHAVLGQRAGLVGADHVGRAERLDRAQALDDRAAPHELAHPDRERERDDRQQSLGHVADEQADGEDDRVADRQAGAEHGERDERDADRRTAISGDEPSHPADLALERALLALHALGQRRDAPELGAHPGREDDARAASPPCRSCR